MKTGLFYIINELSGLAAGQHADKVYFDTNRLYAAARKGRLIMDANECSKLIFKIVLENFSAQDRRRRLQTVIFLNEKYQKRRKFFSLRFKIFLRPAAILNTV